jgi:hypothetical protein
MSLIEAELKPTSRWTHLVWPFIWLGTTLVALFLTPSSAEHGTHQQLGLPPCPSVLLFDRPCPGCGLTTSWTALVHGDFSKSFSAHALGPLLYGIFTVTAVAGVYGWWKRIRFRTETLSFTLATYVFMAIFLAYGGIRMLVVTNYAAPHERPLMDLVRISKSKQGKSGGVVDSGAGSASLRDK